MQTGFDFKLMGGLPAMSPEEEREVAKRAARGDDDARERMVRCNMGLVVKEARRYVRLGGLEMEDLVNAGATGIVIALVKYDPGRGLKFSTYAVPWICAAIERANEAHSLIHIPEFTGYRARTIQRIIQGLGRSATVRQITDAAMKAGLSDGHGGRLKKNGVRNTVEFLLSPTSHPVQSLDAMRDGRNGDGETAFEPIDHGSDPARACETAELAEAVLKSLPERQRKVFGMRRGIGTPDSIPMTVREVASATGLGVDRVRQLEREAVLRIEELKDVLMGRVDVRPAGPR